jgi:hypothetical protein
MNKPTEPTPAARATVTPDAATADHDKQRETLLLRINQAFRHVSDNVEMKELRVILTAYYLEPRA